MSHSLPITFGFFTSTKGHHSRKTDWRLTLNHWDKQVPLTLFNLVAHIKISPDEIELGESMCGELEARGFHVLTTVGSWQRGLSHGGQYLRDQITVSKDPHVYKQPYFMLVEDDSLAVGHQLSVEDLLLKSCARLAENHELISARLIRRCDYDGGVDKLDVGPGWFYSPHLDFQPVVLRSLDFHRLGIILEQNPRACDTVHCEQLWALILGQFSRNPLKHFVYHPDVAETIHIGIPTEEHNRLIIEHNLA